MKEAKRLTAVFIYAILAGVCIGLGGTVYLRLKDTFSGSNIAGALFFGIGLFAVCTRGYNLFTGKVCYVFDNKPSYIIDLIIIWLGDLAGVCILALILSCTGIYSGISRAARELVEIKQNSSLSGLFFLGIICNIFIYFAVDGYKNNPHQAGKYLAIFLGVSVFILCGTEHSVADMFYFAVSGQFTANFSDSLLRILIITAGNIVGGISFPLLEKLYRYLCMQSRDIPQ